MSEIQFAIAKAAQHATSEGTGRRAVIPSPVYGWNSQDPEAGMKPQFAISMDNYFPDRGKVVSRRGSTKYAEGVGTDSVKTLFTWISGSLERLYAVSGSMLYDVSDPENVSASVMTGITNSRWRSVMMNGHGILVNGTDEPLRIDGAGDWVPHGFTGTGLATVNLTQAAVFKNRLFFLEKDSAKLWYGDLNAITGDLNSFNLGLVNEAGGNCVALGSLTLDTGVGVDDLLVVFMSRGHVLVYAGTNPASANEWALSGIFHLGRVVGDQPLVKLGGDLIAITSDGYIPLLQFLGKGREQRQLAISDKIAPNVTQAARLYGDEKGWQPILHSPANWLLFNVPTGPTNFQQHVMNVQTGAWCRFRGWNSQCWETYKDQLYYGGPGGKVYHADQGGTDEDTASIRGVVRTAYNYLGSPYDKKFNMLQAHVESDAIGAQVQIGATVDFDRTLPPLTPRTIEREGTAWDAGAWDTFQWGSGRGQSRVWTDIAESGAAISVHLGSFTRGDPLFWFSTNVLYDQVKGIAN